MASREDFGSWLDGGASARAGSADGAGSGAERLGLPPSGSGSLASLGRRAVAIFVDWAAASAIAALFATGDAWAPLAVFAVMQVVLVGTVGYSLGHRLLGLQVRVLGAPGTGTVDGAVVGLWRAVVRTVLLCLVIPAVVWDGEGRGLHDRAAGTVIVRR